MRLKSFKIANYKSIEDSGEVPVGDYTVLVGKNESGKTSVLKALHKFNSTKREPYDGLREFPRKRFHEFKGDEPIITLTFKLDEEEKEYLEKIDERYAKIEKVKVTKDYTSKFTFGFIPSIKKPVLTLSSISSQISRLKDSINECDLSKIQNEDEITSEIQKVDEIKIALSDAFDKVGEGITKSKNLWKKTLNLLLFNKFNFFKIYQEMKIPTMLYNPF